MLYLFACDARLANISEPDQIMLSVGVWKVRYWAANQFEDIADTESSIDRHGCLVSPLLSHLS